MKLAYECSRRLARVMRQPIVSASKTAKIIIPSDEMLGTASTPKMNVVWTAVLLARSESGSLAVTLAVFDMLIVLVLPFADVGLTTIVTTAL